MFSMHSLFQAGRIRVTKQMSQVEEGERTEKDEDERAKRVVEEEVGAGEERPRAGPPPFQASHPALSPSLHSSWVGPTEGQKLGLTHLHWPFPQRSDGF